MKISTYLKVTFPTSDETHSASKAIMNLMADPGHMGRMVGPNRVVVWEAGLLPSQQRALYLSQGAFDLLSAHHPLPAPETVPSSALPPNRVLLLGDNRFEP